MTFRPPIENRRQIGPALSEPGPVEIDRDRVVRVAELLLHPLGRSASDQEEGGVGMAERVDRVVLWKGSDASGLIEGPLDRPGVDGLAQVRPGKDDATRRVERFYAALERARGRWRQFDEACLAALRRSHPEPAAVVRLLNAQSLILHEHVTFLETEELSQPEPAARVNEEGVRGPVTPKLPRRE